MRKHSPLATRNQTMTQGNAAQLNELLRQVGEKDKLIDKLYFDIKELHGKVEKVSHERNEAVEKFSESEKYWRQKQHKADKEYQGLFELNTSVKEDNHSLLI